MKRHKHLFPKISAFENLLLASRRARRGKRERPDVALFEYHLECELLQLQEELQNGKYVPGPYRSFWIHDPKKRLISAALYRDRVVHHALCNVIEPLFDQSYIFDSYACRMGKGTHAAIERFQYFARRNRYVLKCDIRKYFPSIDHEILLALIKRKIGCPQALDMIEKIINGSNDQEPMLRYFPGDDLFTPFERPRGLPIGNLTSQVFANVYLNGLDHFIKQNGGRCYVRYADDLALFADSRDELWRLCRRIEDYLANLRVALNEHKSQVIPTEIGCTFLGFRVYPHHRVLLKSKARRYMRRLRRLSKDYAEGRANLNTISRSVQGWVAHASFGRSSALRRSIFWQIRFIRKTCSPAETGFEPPVDR